MSDFVHDFFVEFMPAMFAVLGGIALTIGLITVTLYTTMDPPTCRANGSKMGIEVDWEFWTGCMGHVQGTWLPWSQIVPVERDGKIVFAPKPIFRLQEAK